MRQITTCFTIILTLFFGVSAHSTEWPQELVADNGTVVLVYQPQVEVFTGNDLEARAAISVKGPSTEGVPVFGAIWIKASLDTDRDTRTAVIRDIEITEVRFADVSDEDRDALATFIEDSVSGTQMSISVDQLLADLDM